MLIIIILLYTLINFYILSKMIKWINNFIFKYKKLCIYFISVIYILLYLTPIFGYFLPISSLQKGIQLAANCFMGVLLHICIITFLYSLFRFFYIKVFKKDNAFFSSKKYLIGSAIFTILIISFLSIYGIVHVKNIYVNKYDITIEDKKTNLDSLKIVLLADLHLGYNIGSDVIHNMVDKINNEKADLVIIAGDIFDNSTETVDDVDKIISYLKNIKSKYGVYATFGNHDVEEKLFAGFKTSFKKKYKRSNKMEEILKDANIIILDDDVKEFNDFYLIGRKDYKRPGDGTKNREDISTLLNNLDTRMPIIVIDHEPRDLKELSKYPIDLYLSGHTHNGQFFPLTLVTNIIWSNPYGYKKYNNLNSVVTSGIGVYGPNMRIGSNSEIVVINVNFK